MSVSVVPDKMDHMTSELVGRDAELEQLCSTLGISASADRDASSVGAERSAVLLAGDAGVGKTRLLTELRDRAVAHGWLVQAGHCLDFADSALPFLPFSEITGRIARELPDLFDEVTERHPALLRLLPGQRMLSQATDPESVPADQAALFDAVHALAEGVGRSHCLLLVVEDLHWADQSTRDLMSFLFGRGFQAPVALVASYRSDDLHRRHPLRRQLTTWARMSGVERVQVEAAPPADPSVRPVVVRLRQSGQMVEPTVVLCRVADAEIRVPIWPERGSYEVPGAEVARDDDGWTVRLLAPGTPSQVEVDQATTSPVAESDLLGEDPPVEKPSKEKAAKAVPVKSKTPKTEKGKAAQMALFADKPVTDKKPARKSAKPAKRVTLRRKK